MTLALAQHDLYFGRELKSEELFYPGNTTLMHLWRMARNCAETVAKGGEPWFKAHYRRLQRIDKFSHKTLQHPHEHMAAYYRWMMRSTEKPAFAWRGKDYLRRYWVFQWRSYLHLEIPDLLAVPGLLRALCQTVLYRHFERSNRSAADLDKFLIGRYGMDCVRNTWRTDPQMCKVMGIAA